MILSQKCVNLDERVPGKSFAIVARFDRPQNCLFELVNLQLFVQTLIFLVLVIFTGLV